LVIYANPCDIAMQVGKGSRQMHVPFESSSSQIYGSILTAIAVGSGHADIDRMQQAVHRWAGLIRTARSQLVGYYLAAVWAG